MLKDAVPRMARLLGVPCVHGSHTGRFTAFAEPDLPNVEFRSQFLGETMIVDRDGSVLASLNREAGAGFVTGDIGLQTSPAPTEKIPDGIVRLNGSGSLTLAWRDWLAAFWEAFRFTGR